MADTSALLTATAQTTTLGNTISRKMLNFLDAVHDQPAGFRPLGLDFLSVSQTLNSLSTSLSSHAPNLSSQAVSELTKILAQTKSGFESLEGLLEKFMDYEKGGVSGRVMKSWRSVFADKDIAKVKRSLVANKGALTMAMLLIDINPNANPAATTYEYGMLAAKLQSNPGDGEGEMGGAESAPFPSISELPADEKEPQELDDTEIDPKSYQLAGESSVSRSTTMDEDMVTPSVSEMAISDRVGEPSVVSALSAVEQQDLPQEPKMLLSKAPEQTAQEVAPNQATLLVSEPVSEPKSLLEIPSKPTIIHIDRSTLKFTAPTSTAGATNTALQSALISACNSNKSTIVSQLLSRGVVATSKPRHALGAAVQSFVPGEDGLATLRILLEYGTDPNAPATDGNTALRAACQLTKREACVQLLLQYGADPNILAPDYPPLCYALSDKNAEIVSLLFHYGADPNLLSTDGMTVLLYACVRDSIPLELVTKLLYYGADPNKKNKNGDWEPLYTACQRNRPELVKVLLAHGADPNLKALELPIVAAVRYPACLQLLLEAKVDLKQKKGILEIAVACKNIESVKLLLHAGADINEKAQGVFTPLTTAIRENRSDIIELLIHHRVDLNLKGQDMPLFMATKTSAILSQLLAAGADLDKAQGVMEMAVYHNNIESVSILLDAGVNPNDKKDRCFSPLTTAIRDNRQDILKLLLSRGADPNLKGQDIPLWMATRNPAILKILLSCPRTDLSKAKGVLEMAVYHNNIESVKILLDAGVDINEKKDKVFTPLTTAVRDKRSDILALLLKRGANPNLKGQDVPLFMAVKDIAILKQLLAGGADVHHPSSKGVIDAAVGAKSIEAIDILLAAGADVNEKRGDVFLPLTTALVNNSVDIIKHLLSKGANPNLGSGHGLPVMMAVGYKDPKQERLRILLDAGADVNVKGGNGRTAPMEAVERNNTEVVKLLIERGADVGAVDGSGRGAMDIAAAKGWDELVMVLLEAMG